MIPAVLAISMVFGEPPGKSAPKPDKSELLKVFREEFVEITPGKGDFPSEFTMGADDESPACLPTRVARMARAFRVARYEVPQNLWEAVMGANPSKWPGPRNSVEMLSFEDAVEFCRRVTVDLRAAGLIEKNERVRLPSEVEWEYFARAGTKTRYSFGEDVGSLDDHAWSHRNAAGNDPPVGAKKPNPWELYDVHGYLWEWCADPWHEDYAGAPTSAQVWDQGGDAKRRVLRGGSWKDNAESLTSATRRGEASDFKDDAVGLRCVLDMGEAP